MFMGEIGKTPEQPTLSRRKFIKAAAGGLAAATLGREAQAQEAAGLYFKELALEELHISYPERGEYATEKIEHGFMLVNPSRDVKIYITREGLPQDATEDSLLEDSKKHYGADPTVIVVGNRRDFEIGIYGTEKKMKLSGWNMRAMPKPGKSNATYTEENGIVNGDMFYRISYNSTNPQEGQARSRDYHLIMTRMALQNQSSPIQA
jgi:hypothetical protein